jgi:hypothetical protein
LAAARQRDVGGSLAAAVDGEDGVQWRRWGGTFDGRECGTMSGRDGGTTRVNAATIRHTRGRCNERTTRGGFTGDVCQIFGRGGFRHSNFETRRTKAIEPPGPRQQRHKNQTMDEKVGAQVARGVCMGGRSDLPFLPCCCHG